MKNFRDELSQRERDVVGDEWAGGLPVQEGRTPRIRIGKNRWFDILLILPIGFVLLITAIAVAKGLRTMPAVEHFINQYPGLSLADGAKEHAGLPRWVAWQHFFNMLLMIPIMRAGLSILADHPRLYWHRSSVPGSEWFRMHRAVPPETLYTAKDDSVTLPPGVGLPSRRHSIGLARWWHLSMDSLWLLNGIVFYVLIFVTWQWHRLIPTSWDVFPNALSVAIQYASLNWPIDHPWVGYNALQQLAYFVTVFIAAPLAFITGLGMSPALSTKFKWISRFFSIQLARSLHFFVLLWFVFFIIVHVTLVVATDALHNFNVMYAGNNGHGWGGFIIFAISLAILVFVWVSVTPLTNRHPRVVQRIGFAIVGPFQKLFEHVDSKPGEYTEADISTHFWKNGTYPNSQEYSDLQANNFEDYKLQISGMVENPQELSLADLRALPYHDQITQHYCIQGWSGVAKWGGVQMSTIVDLVKPSPKVKWVVFYSFADGSDGGLYYDAQPIEQMSYHLTMLAYNMNDETLPYGHGAPLRLRNEVQHGFKMVKWIKGIEFVENFSDIGSGWGSYNSDHEFFGYRQSI